MLVSPCWCKPVDSNHLPPGYQPGPSPFGLACVVSIAAPPPCRGSTTGRFGLAQAWPGARTPGGAANYGASSRNRTSCLRHVTAALWPDELRTRNSSCRRRVPPAGRLIRRYAVPVHTTSVGHSRIENPGGSRPRATHRPRGRQSLVRRPAWYWCPFRESNTVMPVCDTGAFPIWLKGRGACGRIRTRT